MDTDPLLEALETIRQRLCGEVEILDGAGIPVPPAAIPALADAMSPDGSWPDVDYANDHPKDWAAAEHLARLHAMARGWFQPGTPIHGAEAVRAAILRGLDFWYARNPRNSNWWWMDIGAPLLLGDTLLCMQGACDRSYVERARPTFACQQPIHAYTGQNLVWVAWTRIQHGILTGDPALVSQGYIAIGNEVRLALESEGIQPDMSFHQHGKLLYSGGYGSSFAADVSRLIAVAAGTPYAWPPHLVDRVSGYVLDGCRWMVRGRTFDPSACGREITRQGHSAARFRVALRHLASFDHARRAEAQAAAAVDPAAGRSLVAGNRHFWCSDFMVQHRPAYGLSVRLTSRRLLDTDWACGGGEGRLCHHMAEGATFVMRDGDEYRDLYPVWNWQQIPGTTVVRAAADFDPEALRRFGERAFAGGASDGNIGCAAMDFSRADFRARKAWFFFEDGVVALGAGIAAPATAPVRTMLNQCRWRGPALMAAAAAPLAAGEYRLGPGTVFWHDGVAYRVLDGTGTLRLGPQSGAWSDCGVGSPERLTLDVMNAGLDHGVGPAGATYAYAVIPGVEAGAVFVEDPARRVVVSNTPALQAVWHAGDGRGHAVFYEPGAVTFPDGQRVAVDRPCIVLYHPRRDGAAELTVAQPEQRDGLIAFRLDGRLRAAVAVSLPSGTHAGSSMSVVWPAAGH